MIHWSWLIPAVIITAMLSILTMAMLITGKITDNWAKDWNAGHQEGYHMGFHVGYRKGFHARIDRDKKDGQPHEPD